MLNKRCIYNILIDLKNMSVVIYPTLSVYLKCCFIICTPLCSVFPNK